MRVWAVAGFLLAGLAGLRPAAADRAVHGDHFDVGLPDAFRPTSGAWAREACLPLRDLLAALGVEAIGARRATAYLVGPETEPEATFLARAFALRGSDRDPLGTIGDAALAAGWARYADGRKGHVALAPARLTFGGRPGILLGGSDPRPDGVRVERWLLLPTPTDVLVLRFTTTAADVAAAQAQWQRLLDGLVLETVSPGSPLLQGLALGVALGAAGTAGLLWLLRRRRRREERPRRADAPPAPAPVPRRGTLPAKSAVGAPAA